MLRLLMWSFRTNHVNRTDTKSVKINHIAEVAPTVAPEEVLPLIVEEELANVGERPSESTVSRRHNSDLTADTAVYGPDDSAIFAGDGAESNSCPSLEQSDRPRAQSELLTSKNGNEQSQKGSRISPRAARRSVMRLGRTLR